MNDLVELKKQLTGPGAVQMFRDAIPSVVGLTSDQAEQVSKRYGLQVYAACQQNADLCNVDRRTLFREACKAASLDLDIDLRGLAYLVPYKGQAQLIIGYKGLIELAYRSGRVKSISAEVIYDSEKNSVVVDRTNGKITIYHPWTWEKPGGHIVAVYATADIEGCAPMTALLRIDEVEEYRKKSAAPNGFGWRDNYAAMCKKTAIRRLSTYLPKSIMDRVEKALASEDQATFAETAAKNQTTISDQAGSQVMDAVFEGPADAEPDWLKDE